MSFYFIFFFFFKQKTAYEMLRSLVGSEMCIRDRYQRRVRGSDFGEKCRGHHPNELTVCPRWPVSLARRQRQARGGAGVPWQAPLERRPACRVQISEISQWQPAPPLRAACVTVTERSTPVSYTHLTLPTKRIV
eukprot:TRINITY_DN7064_c0_g1_i3.p1 TRINITY_DN7064_c0_g1~~TRINITY_DN7064_c0_g1_i3.p1  ORF type:complete len:134 (+),score=22.24 TRINITY_DN7064_c0_g1_i3:101-502(+)